MCYEKNKEKIKVLNLEKSLYKPELKLFFLSNLTDKLIEIPAPVVLDNKQNKK